MSEENPTKTVIPPEFQPFCDQYLGMLRNRMPEYGKKGNEALQRAITYFSMNPEALFREVQNQLKVNPSYFGVEQVSGQPSKSETQVIEPIIEKHGRHKKNEMGPVEATILEELEARFASDEALQDLSSGKPMRGTKS